MNMTIAEWVVWSVFLLGAAWRSAASEDPPLYDFKVQDIDGEIVSLGRYKGQVLLIVNVASRCGLTKQYAGLQHLYEKYGAQGFSVLGFPSNDFMGQEPGTESEIKAFCTTTFGVRFPLFSKIRVQGDDMHPLYAFLTSKERNPGFGGKITWNFNKFLIGRDGRVLARFDSRVEPENDQLIQAVEKALTEPGPGAPAAGS